jgi:hypothetical protein
MAATTQNATKVVTGKVRLSYVHIFEPFKQGDDDGEGKYSCVILIPKKDKQTLSKIRAAIKAAAEQGKNSKFDGKIPKNLATTLHDGDDEDTLEKNPEYENHYYMSISSKTRPGVVDSDVDPIMDSTEVYSGCYARVSINAFPYNYKGKKGVSFGLNHVQKLADGDYLGGRSRAEDDFDVYGGSDYDEDSGEDDSLI